MPKRADIQKILIIGSGPIQIGQACEFDYSGTQAVKALTQEGYEVILVNSNPATIMTDPELADHTYIEPLTPEVIEKIIETTRPHALLPTLGGQVALNLAMELHRRGVLKKYQVEMLGASVNSIELAENREKFKELLFELQLPVLNSQIISSLTEGLKAAENIGYPLVLRPSFTLGGTGGSIVFNQTEIVDRLMEALRASPTSQVLMEESVVGWKEIELEVMRDRKNNFVVVCSIENVDPMGIHTGDSITVAPVMTLTDKELQRLREASKKILNGVKVETGGCNIQFALDPKSSQWVVIEMNPRVSRSSALASKATGFPIAKLAALLAVGFHLDELQNDITQKTPACFEPTLDYVVVKVPRFTFEKFKQTEPMLGTQMKSVGEAMALGRTFKEAFQKAFDSLEEGSGFLLPSSWRSEEITLETIRSPRYDRWWLIAELLRQEQATVEEIQEATFIDSWFLKQLSEIIEIEKELKKYKGRQLSSELLLKTKSAGFSDETIAKLLGVKTEKIRQKRKKYNIEARLNPVDTCAGEFEAVTPYYYFSYERMSVCHSEPKAKNLNPSALPQDNKKANSVIIIGSGPNRIGQGIEFDYCCVKAAETVRAMGYEAVMVNCNPETVSTDYDISDRLYFEPLHRESIERVIEEEKKSGEVLGILCQTGGQTALKLSQFLNPQLLLGTKPEAIDCAENRAKFDRVLSQLRMKRPRSASVRSLDRLLQVGERLGYPVLVRPSYVLGGRSMEIVRSSAHMERLKEMIQKSSDIQFPLLIDTFLDNAIEIDVDCIGDGREIMVLAIMEHIEEAGIHSGDSSCILPAVHLSESILEKIKEQAIALGKKLDVNGFLNIQFALVGTKIFILEVNPRTSRTLPFVCKATGQDWVQVGVRAMLGVSFQQQSVEQPPLFPSDFSYCCVKEVVFPFSKFPNVDVLLGPEMKSTGEVMSFGKDFEEAFLKGLLASGHRLPKKGKVFISVKDSDKSKIIPMCQQLLQLGFQLVATHGTHRYLETQGIKSEAINKVKEGQPHIVDAIINQNIDLIINTTEGEKSIADSFSIRRSALQMGVPYFTTLTAAQAAVRALPRWISGEIKIVSLQEIHKLNPQELEIGRQLIVHN